MKENCTDAIGIFDSGLGGLTVVSAVRKALPYENLIYLGDTARVPYGNRSADTVRKFAEQDLCFLTEKRVKTVVIACNTASAAALDYLRERYPDVSVTGVIQPGVESVIRSGCRRVAVLGTRGTIRSGAYENALRKADCRIQVENIPCPLFVPLAEEGITEGEIVQSVFQMYLKPLTENPPDAVMLGCTHYPLFVRSLREYLPPSVKIIDSSTVCAEYLTDYLRKNDLRNPSETPGSMKIYVTDYPMEFKRQSVCFFGESLPDAERVTLT